jgi:uncharacterized protein
MLFIFEEEGLYSFWMKNMTMPIDMVFISGNGSVVYVKHSAQPCTADPCEIISPQQKFMYVLEIRSGAASLLGIKENDHAEISI